MPQFIKPSKGETVSPPTQSRPKPERTTVQKPVHTTHKLYYGIYLNKTVYKHIFHSEILKMLSVSTFYLMSKVILLVKTTFLFEVDQLFLYSRSQNFSFQCLTDTSYSTIYCLNFVIFQISAIITLCSFFIFGFFLVFPLESVNLSFQVVKFLVYSKHQCYLHLMLRFIRIGKPSFHLMGIHSKIFPFVLFSSFIIRIYCQFYPLQCPIYFIVSDRFIAYHCFSIEAEGSANLCRTRCIHGRKSVPRWERNFDWEDRGRKMAGTPKTWRA